MNTEMEVPAGGDLEAPHRKGLAQSWLTVIYAWSRALPFKPTLDFTGTTCVLYVWKGAASGAFLRDPLQKLDSAHSNPTELSRSQNLPTTRSLHLSGSCKVYFSLY